MAESERGLGADRSRGAHLARAGRAPDLSAIGGPALESGGPPLAAFLAFSSPSKNRRARPASSKRVAQDRDVRARRAACHRRRANTDVDPTPAHGKLETVGLVGPQRLPPPSVKPLKVEKKGPSLVPRSFPWTRLFEVGPGERHDHACDRALGRQGPEAGRRDEGQRSGDRCAERISDELIARKRRLEWRPPGTLTEATE